MRISAPMAGSPSRSVIRPVITLARGSARSICPSACAAARRDRPACFERPALSVLQRQKSWLRSAHREHASRKVGEFVAAFAVGRYHPPDILIAGQRHLRKSDRRGTAGMDDRGRAAGPCPLPARSWPSHHAAAHAWAGVLFPRTAPRPTWSAPSRRSCRSDAPHRNNSRFSDRSWPSAIVKSRPEERIIFCTSGSHSRPPRMFRMLRAA